MSLESTPSEGAISVEQAVGLLNPSDAPAETVETVEEEETDASATEADEPSEAEEPGDGEEAETQEPETPAVDAPHWWTAEKKARFAELPADLQAIVHEEEANRERVTSKAKEESANARNRAEAEFNTYQQTLTALGQWLPNAVQTFQSRWTGVDWVYEAQTRTAEDYNALRAQYEQETAQVQQAEQEVQKGQALFRQRTLAEEGQKLATLAPALVDPKEGAARQTELTNYLLSQGATQPQVNDLNALAISLAWKAHLYDKAQASLATPRPRPTPSPQRGNVQPTAAPVRTSSQRSIEQVQARFAKSGSIDDAVALLQAQRKSG